MFKPAKLSSQLTENQVTPDKGKQQDIHIDITLDLSERGLPSIPELSTFISNGNSPTIIDLRKNQIAEVPQEIFMIPTLQQLKLSHNQIRSLPADLSEPHKCRLILLNLSNNYLQEIPDWIYFHKLRQTLEKLDLSFNPDFKNLPNTICNLENMKQLLLQGNNISELPKQMHKLNKIEEFGLEWWQYISLDEKRFGRKLDFEGFREESLVTNLQTLRQIFETFRVLASLRNSQTVSFIDFYRQYMSLYQLNRKLEENDLNRIVFQSICFLGHTHLNNQLLTSNSQVLLNKADAALQGQTLFQMALHLAPQEDFILNILSFMKTETSFANFEVYQQRPNEDLPLQRQQQLLHPIMISFKRKFIKVASEIINLMKSDALKSQQSSLTLDVKDENRNTIFHHAFAMFLEDSNSKKAQLFCNEIFQIIKEQQGFTFNVQLNEMNKQGMTPLDLAIELRINQAVQFCMDCNHDSNYQYFQTNFNNNQRGLTPLHRAVQAHNHFALFILLQSQTCDSLLRDKDYKKARDYCQRILFMQKLLRNAEMLQLMSHYLQLKHRGQKASFFLTRRSDVVHSFINTQMVKAFLQNKQQYQSSIKKKLIKSSESKFKALKRSASEIKDFQKSSFNIVERQSIEKCIQIERPMPFERIVHSSTYNKTVIEAPYVFPQQIIEDIIIEQAPLFVSSIEAQKQQVQRQSQKSKKSKPPIKPHPKSSANKLPKQSAKNITNIRPKMTQPDPHFQSVDKTSPGFKEDDADEEEAVKIFGLQALGPKELQSSQSQKDRSSKKHMKLMDVSNFDTFIFDEADASEESPTALPSNKFQYIMTVNNSKLARRPYYKKLIKNQFEHQFCQLMECPYYMQTQNSKLNMSDTGKKLQILYLIYAKGLCSQNNDQTKTDCLEFFSLLIHELLDPIEGIALKPFMNEIIYLHDQLNNQPQNSHQIPAKKVNQPENVEISQTKLPQQFSVSIQNCTQNENLPTYTAQQYENHHHKTATTPLLRMPKTMLQCDGKQSKSKSPISEPALIESNYNTQRSEFLKSPKIEENGGLVLMKTLRQSVSLKSLIQCNQFTKINPLAEALLQHEENDQQTQNEDSNQNQSQYKYLNFHSHRRYPTKSSQSIVGQLIENSNLSIDKEPQLIFFNDIKSPTSPRADSGQIISKDAQNNQKPALIHRDITNISDISSPLPPTTSEQSVRTLPKRKQNLQILDSSIRTVQIHIEAAGNRGNQTTVGHNLKNRHSKMVKIGEPLSPNFIEKSLVENSSSGKKVKTFNQYLKSSTNTSSNSSLHRQYQKLTRGNGTSTMQASRLALLNNLGQNPVGTQQLRQYEARSKLQKRFNTFTTSTSNPSQLSSHRSLSQTKRYGDQSLIPQRVYTAQCEENIRRDFLTKPTSNNGLSSTHRNHNKHKTVIKGYQSQINCLPQSNPVILARPDEQRKRTITAVVDMEGDDVYYKGANTFNMNLQNPCS